MFFFNLILLLFLNEVTGNFNRAVLTIDELRFTAVEKEDENLKDIGNMTICLGVRETDESAVECSFLEDTFVIDYSKEQKRKIETASVLPEKGAVLQFSFRVEKDNGQWTTHTFVSPHNIAGKPIKTLAENTYEYQFSASVKLDCLNGFAAPTCLTAEELPPPVVNTAEKATYVTEEFIDDIDGNDESVQELSQPAGETIMDMPEEDVVKDDPVDSAGFYRRRTIFAYIAGAIALVLVALVIWKVVLPYIKERKSNSNRCRDNENRLTEV